MTGPMTERAMTTRTAAIALPLLGICLASCHQDTPSTEEVVSRDSLYDLSGFGTLKVEGTGVTVEQAALSE